LKVISIFREISSELTEKEIHSNLEKKKIEPIDEKFEEHLQNKRIKNQ
jgi:hypothetical protein